MTSVVPADIQPEYDDKAVAVVIRELPIPTSVEASRRTSLEDKRPELVSQYDPESVQPTHVEEWDGGWDAWSSVAGG